MQPSEISTVCRDIQVLRRELKFIIGLKNKITNASMAELRSSLGYRSDMGERQRAGLVAESAELFGKYLRLHAYAAKQVREAAPGDKKRGVRAPSFTDRETDIIAMSRHMLEVAATALEPVHAREKLLEEQITALASNLPVAEWWTGLRGCTAFNLGVLIGETGNLSNYPSPRHVWSRLGLAPFEKNGTSQALSVWRRAGGLSAKEWKAHPYNPQRLATVHGYVLAAFAMQQGTEEKGTATKYRMLYSDYKARQKELNEAGAYFALAEEKAKKFEKAGLAVAAALKKGRLTDGHIESRARRYMIKCLISDLWSEWRGSAVGVETREPLDPSDNSADDRPAADAA